MNREAEFGNQWGPGRGRGFFAPVQACLEIPAAKKECCGSVTEMKGRGSGFNPDPGLTAPYQY
jgi:hypothetical protein